MDIQMMLFLGFGFLMTYLRRYGYGALVLTMGVISVCAEWGVVCWAFFNWAPTAADYYLYITWFE